MPKIKLKEWAEKHNLSYLTANRHFHAGMIPGAVQLDSGTILVEDDSQEQNMAATTSNDAMTIFLKKTVEFSKNNSTVEDFAAYVISNFQLKLNGVSDNPRYSKNKPKSEEIQKHFQKFIPDPKDVEHLKAVKTLLKEGKTAGDVVPAAQANTTAELSAVLGNSTPFERVQEVGDGVGNDFDDFTTFLSDAQMGLTDSTEGLVTSSVDLNTTPQQINYTGSTSQAFSSTPFASTTNPINWGPTSQSVLNGNNAANVNWGPTSDSFCFNSASSPFQPTQKEVLSASKVIETAETDAPRKRGRKPSKKR